MWGWLRKRTRDEEQTAGQNVQWAAREAERLTKAEADAISKVDEARAAKARAEAQVNAPRAAAEAAAEVAAEYAKRARRAEMQYRQAKAAAKEAGKAAKRVQKEAVQAMQRLGRTHAESAAVEEAYTSEMKDRAVRHALEIVRGTHEERGRTQRP